MRDETRFESELEALLFSPTGDDFLNIHNRMLVICKDLTSSTTNTSLAILDLSGGLGAKLTSQGSSPLNSPE